MSILNNLLTELYYKDPVQFFNDLWKDRGYKASKGQIELLQLMRRRDPIQNRIMICSANSTGKTIVLATIALDLVTTISSKENYGIKVLVASGSWSQAQTLYEYVQEALKNPYIRSFIKGEPIKTYSQFITGGFIRAVTASEKQVWGKHVDCLMVDEAVEVEERIIKDTYSRVAGSPYGWIILSSTPEPKYYFSKFVSMWEKKRDYPEPPWKRLNWSSYDCSWLEKDIEEAKKDLMEHEFKSKWLGIPTFQIITGLFPIKDLEDCKGDTTFNNELESVMGYDFGYGNPAVAIITQRIDNKTYIVYGESMKEKGWNYTFKRLKVLQQQYNVSIINADSSRPELITDLRTDMPCRINAISFKGQKPSMQGNLHKLVSNHGIVIPEKYITLLKQMAMYTDKTQTNDDWVDALMLATRESIIVPSMWKFILHKKKYYLKERSTL